MAKTLSADAMPLCMRAFTRVSRLMGENSSAIAVKKLTKSLMVIAPSSNWLAHSSRPGIGQLRGRSSRVTAYRFSALGSMRSRASTVRCFGANPPA